MGRGRCTSFAFFARHDQEVPGASGRVSGEADAHPGFRSFLLVLLLSALTLGIFWFYYLYRMFEAADRRRGAPFFRKTYWTMVVLAALTVVALLWVGLPGFGSYDGPLTSYQQDGEAMEPPFRVLYPPESGGLGWQTNATEILIVAYATVTAVFLFLEIARFRPVIASPIALPTLVLAYLPFVFIPGVAWGALLVSVLYFIALHDLHRGLMAFFDGETLDGEPYDAIADATAEPA